MRASSPADCRKENGTNDLTRVELTWLEKRIEHWIRFGRIAEVTIVDRRRRVVSFARGAVFAFVRCARRLSNGLARARRSPAVADLERQRQRADRALRDPYRWRSASRRSGRHQAARAARELPR
jgi:Protein of unknown function (DUF2840)